MRVEHKNKIAEESRSISLAEQLEGMKSELVERVDAYLEYVAQEWVEENALQIEQGLKTEMTESFLEGMKSLLKIIMYPSLKINMMLLRIW